MLLTTAVTCLALNIYHEGRGESDLGKKIIAQTTLNRADHNSGNVCREVMRPYQFSWTNNLVVGRQLKARGKPKEKEVWEKCQIIARQALSGNLNLPSRYRKVTHFHTPSIRPSWASRKVRLGRVGGHVYYKDFIKK